MSRIKLNEILLNSFILILLSNSLGKWSGGSGGQSEGRKRDAKNEKELGKYPAIIVMTKISFLLMRGEEGSLSPNKNVST